MKFFFALACLALACLSLPALPALPRYSKYQRYRQPAMVTGKELKRDGKKGWIRDWTHLQLAYLSLRVSNRCSSNQTRSRRGRRTSHLFAAGLSLCPFHIDLDDSRLVLSKFSFHLEGAQRGRQQVRAPSSSVRYRRATLWIRAWPP